MLPDIDTQESIKRQLVSALWPSFDHVERTEDGSLFLVQDGFWFTLRIEPQDNGEDA